MVINKILALFVVGSFLTVLLSFAEYLIGRVFLLIPSMRFCGLKLVSMSGLFSKTIPSLCPKHVCKSGDCKNWICPLYCVFHAEQKKGT